MEMWKRYFGILNLRTFSSTMPASHTYKDLAKKIMPKLMEGLTTPLTEKEKTGETIPREERPRIAFTGDYEECLGFLNDEFIIGWPACMVAGMYYQWTKMTDDAFTTPYRLLIEHWPTEVPVNCSRVLYSQVFNSIFADKRAKVLHLFSCFRFRVVPRLIIRFINWCIFTIPEEQWRPGSGRNDWWSEILAACSSQFTAW